MSIIPAHKTGEPDAPYRVAFACGGTAGHVYPAIAAADAFARAHGSESVLFIGTHDGFAARLVPPRGYAYEAVRSLPIVGASTSARVRAVARLAGGVIEARRVLEAHGTDLVVGFGGYATVAPLLAGRSLGLRTAIHEANVVAGLANRLLARVVDRIYTGFEPSGWNVAPERVLRTGTPIRGEIALATGPHDGEPGADRPARVFVTGGSLGSGFLNRNAPELLAGVAARGVPLDVVHQCGAREPEAVRRAYETRGVRATVTPFLDDIAATYAWADFAVASSGACTVSELAAAGVPSLLVSWPGAYRDHQARNAAAAAAAGAGWWSREEEWEPDALATRLAALLADRAALEEASRGARRFGVPDAAERLVAEFDLQMTGR